MKPKLLVFILGFIVGLLVALVVPPLLESWLPPGLIGGPSETTGEVVAKRLQEDRLLLTIESDGGAVLATFKEKVDEIDLLVEKGDRVTLGITRYEPFVEDPRILGVKKGPEPAAEEVPAVETLGEGAGPAEPGEGAEGADEGADEGAGGTEAESAPLPPMGPPLEDEPGPAEEPPPG